jgi:hypothetical protein
MTFGWWSAHLCFWERLLADFLRCHGSKTECESKDLLFHVLGL